MTQILIFNQISGNVDIKHLDDVRHFTYRSLKGDKLLAYLTEAVKVSYSDLETEFTLYNKDCVKDSSLEKYNSIDDLKHHFDSAYEAKAYYLVLEFLRKEYNKLSKKNLTMDILLRQNQFKIDVAKQFLEENITNMKFLKAKGKKVKTIDDDEEFSNKTKDQRDAEIQKRKEFLNGFDDKIEQTAKQHSLMSNKISNELLKKYANSNEDIKIIYLILEDLDKFNEKFDKHLTVETLTELCIEENNWKSAYFNVKIMPILYDMNYMKVKSGIPELTLDDIKTKYFTGDDGKVKEIDVQSVNDAVKKLKDDLKAETKTYFEQYLTDYNSLAETSIDSIEKVLKIYPKIPDAEKFLRIEKYLSSIRKMIRKMKTMKYEIPTSLELNEDSFQYQKVVGKINDVSAYEQNIQQQHAQFEALLKKFQEEDSRVKKERQWINPNIAEINRMRSKLGMSSLGIDHYKGMDFDTAQSVINEELRDLNDRSKQKEITNLNNSSLRTSNAIGSGFNTGTTFGGTQGTPLRFGFMASKQTNPLLSSNSLTSSTRPGSETTKSGVGDLVRGNAPLRLTGFSDTSTKPESDSLFSTTTKPSLFDLKKDDSTNKINFDFTKPLRPHNDWEPPVSIRKWMMDKDRINRLKTENWGEKKIETSFRDRLLNLSKPSTEYKLPEIKPLTSPTIITNDNNPLDKIESLSNKKDNEINLSIFKMPKTSRKKSDLLPIPRDKKATIRTKKGKKNLPKRARNNAPLREEKIEEKSIELKPLKSVVRPIDIDIGPSLSDSFEMPTPSLPPRPVEKRETFIPNRNVSKQEVDRKLLEIRKQNKLKNAPMRIQRMNNMSPMTQTSYTPPIQTNNIPTSILENPELRALMKI
ncbi:hypothetical protein M9Y10_013872 [Tritrichomonas musculus]|uniref:FH2 domain-containing protein n=1 Tax=Tritrichomonas musculus TaxID=1915356 RepID=A0ABR2KYW7_9EUKA